jgi:gamma-glutamyl hercynylcysteine S-oxide synthase
MKFSSILNIRKNLFSKGDGPQEGSVPQVTSGNGSTQSDLLATKRYCRILTSQEENDWDDGTTANAWVALEEEMSMVIGGLLSEGTAGSAKQSAEGQIVVQPFYIDRFAVTNADFAHFVSSGAYSEMENWPREIWPNVLQFVDSTGYPGPRFWVNGRPEKNREKHPVVGISWYEANAFALWSGKRLLSSAEWEQAGSWPTGMDGRSGKVRYPWGNSFEPARANIWVGGPEDTVPVDEYYEGCTPNGVYQLVGNVWEWVATPYTCRTGQGGLTVDASQPMGEIRGGAFDTYFETQATCQFRTGQPLLYRGTNVGFRCAVNADKLCQPPQPSAFL